MSTSAIIKVEGLSKVCVYKHYDGYPSGTLDWLVNFNKEFSENRGDDPEYKFAQLLRDSVFSADLYDLDKSKYTGWGVIVHVQDLSYDFVYTLHKDGTVTYKMKRD